MEIKNLHCPSCGASLEWNASSCSFCKTEVRFFEAEGAALPVNLSAADIEANIILHEKEFWNATMKAIDAPYSLYKNFKHYNEQSFKNDFWQSNGSVLKMFYESFLLLPDENYVVIIRGDSLLSYILTSLRLVIVRGTSMLSIPLENFISWSIEAPLSGTNIIGKNGLNYAGQPVLRYFVGENKKEIRFDPDVHIIAESVIQGVCSSKEWVDYKPLQKNLLSLSRYNVNKSYKIQVKPLQLMDVIQESKPKNGCFVATATLGDYNHPIVIQLQEFRDSYLINKRWGRSFTNWYYKNGPFLAKIIENNFLLKKLSFWCIIKPLHHITKYLK